LKLERVHERQQIVDVDAQLRRTTSGQLWHVELTPWSVPVIDRKSRQVPC
jgi:hypothetical protein